MSQALRSVVPPSPQPDSALHPPPLTSKLAPKVSVPTPPDPATIETSPPVPPAAFPLASTLPNNVTLRPASMSIPPPPPPPPTSMRIADCDWLTKSSAANIETAPPTPSLPLLLAEMVTPWAVRMLPFAERSISPPSPSGPDPSARRFAFKTMSPSNVSILSAPPSPPTVRSAVPPFNRIAPATVALLPAEMVTVPPLPPPPEAFPVAPPMDTAPPAVRSRLPPLEPFTLRMVFVARFKSPPASREIAPPPRCACDPPCAEISVCGVEFEVRLPPAATTIVPPSAVERRLSAMSLPFTEILPPQRRSMSPPPAFAETSIRERLPLTPCKSQLPLAWMRTCPPAAVRPDDAVPCPSISAPGAIVKLAARSSKAPEPTLNRALAASVTLRAEKSNTQGVSCGRS